MKFKLVLILLMILGQCLIITGANSAVPNEKELVILAKNYQSHYSTIAKAISLSPLKNSYNIRSISLENWNNNVKADFIICLGDDALSFLSKNNIKKPVLASMITSQQWHRLASQHAFPDSYHAIFYDPDLKRQLALSRLIFPQATQAGILTSQNYHLNSLAIDKFANSLALTVNISTRDDKQSLTRQYAQLIKDNDFVLALPDGKIFNSKTLPRILLTSYRQNKIIIGYSTGTVKSGALATSYTSPSMLANDIIDKVFTLQQGNAKNITSHSKSFDVIVNREVAKSLHIQVKSNQWLKQQIINLLSP